MKLTKQEQKVFNYIRDHRGCTTRDIQREMYVVEDIRRRFVYELDAARGVMVERRV
jgi:hypothetical protein